MHTNLNHHALKQFFTIALVSMLAAVLLSSCADFGSNASTIFNNDGKSSQTRQAEKLLHHSIGITQFDALEGLAVRQILPVDAVVDKVQTSANGLN